MAFKFKFRQPINLKGRDFGKLTAIRLDDSMRNRYRWLCICSCPEKKFRMVDEEKLLSKKVTSCIPCEVRAKMEKW